MSAGPCAIVTRPAAQALPWVAALRAAGVDAQALPLIAIAPPADAAPLAAAWCQLPAQSLVMFVSANAVQHFFSARPPGAPWPADTLAGSTGPGTTDALLAAGVPPQRIKQPSPGMPYETESLWAVLCPLDWRGKQVLLVRGEDGRAWLADTLRAAGADVHFLAAYRRVTPQLDAAGSRLLAAARAVPQAHVWLFSSSEAVGHLGALAPGADWSGARALASHPRIVQAARQAGFGGVGLVAPTVQGVVEVLAAGPGRYNPPGRE